MGKEWSKMRKKNSVCCTPYLRYHASYDFYLWYPCVKWYHQEFFFWVKGVKGQKIAHNGKKLCLSHLISQEPYIIWLSFVVHKCKMTISPAVFLIFSKSWFFGLSGGSKGKKWSKMTKNFVLLHFISQEPFIIWSWFMVHMCKRIISPGVFHTFFKFYFSGSIVR